MTLQYLLFLAATLALTAFIGYNTYMTARLLRTWRPPVNPLLHPAENLIRLAFILVCIGLGWLSGLPWQQLGWSFPQPGQQIVVGFVVGLLLAGAFHGLTYWLVARTGWRYYSPTVANLIIPANRREGLQLTLAMILVVSLEELLFRSLLIGGLSPILPASLLIVVIGVLFGLLHSPQGLWGMAGASLAGILFGWLFVAQESILLPWVAHYTANLVQIGMMTYLHRRGKSPYTTGSSPPVG